MGLPVWEIALGVIVDGQAVAGYFYNPDVALASGGGAWDIVAGAAMLYRNGVVARYINGEEVTFSKELIAKRKLSMPVIYGQEKSIEYFLKHISLR